MFQNKKNFSFERGFLLLVVVINVLIIKRLPTINYTLIPLPSNKLKLS